MQSSDTQYTKIVFLKLRKALRKSRIEESQFTKVIP